MRITFLGGADEVGASSTLVEIAGRRLLVDAGIRLSPKARWGLAGDQLPDLSQVDAAGGLDAILVTHAHTDHTGALELVAERYRCPVYATPVTIALTRVLHADSRRIMQTRLDEEGELPLFDDLAVSKLMDAFVPVPFDTRMPLGGGVAATFYPAGHIAGAAMIGLESDEGRLLLSGDVSLSPQRTVDAPRLPDFRPDVMVIESTYGGRLHANRAAEERRLVDTVAEVTAAGGKVLIPAFALGRAQELILILDQFRRRGEVSVPVWVDGMVRAICGAYTQFPEALPLALQERGARFYDENTRPVARPDQRNSLVWDPSPAVIIASSGMLAGGASMEYARALAGGPQHAILLTGYQDEESPGRRLQEMAAAGRGRLRLGRDMVDVQCRLGTYSLSAHADEGQLLSLVDALDPAEVVLAHGDEGARASLGRRLEERGRSVRSPRSGQALEFHFSPRAGTRRREALGADRPLDTRRLWEGVAGPVGGGYFTSRELAHAWWGEDAAAEDLEDALPAGDLYFAADRPGVYRARTAKQVEALLRRGEALAAWGLRRGQVLFLRDGPDGAVGVARCAGVAAGQFTIEGDPLPRGPEALLDLLEPDEAPADLEAIGALADALAPSLRLQPGTAVTVDDLAEEGGRTHGLSPTDAARRGEPVCSPALRAPEPARRGEPVCSPTAGAPEPARTGQPVCQPTASAPEPARTGQPVCSPAAGAPEPARRGEPVCSPTAGTPDAARTGEPVCSPKPAQPPADLRAALVLALLRAGARREPGGSEYLLPAQAAPVAAAMEPNQALAHVRAQFPPEARLRRCGYRAEEGALTLTFDFPDAAVVRWAEALARIPDETGWQVQVDAEANQGALNALARDLAEGLDLAVAKGPAIYREEKRVAVTVRGGSEGLADACRRFQETTGYALGVLGPGAPDGASGVPAGAAPYPAAGTPAPPNMPSGGEADAATLPGVPASVWITPSAAAPSGLLPAAERALPGLRGDALPLPRPADAPARAEDALTGTRWEINAACAAVRSALAGSTLYRTSLSGDRIVLSFISLPVGERYRAEIEALSRQTGWPLEINPRPNQAAILETARRLAGRWQILKGPGLRADQGTVEMALAVLPDEEERIAAEATFEAQTGFRLVLAEGAPAVAAGPTPVPAEAVEIPVERIRLTAAQRSTVLNPAKADKAVRRALGLGRIAPPLQVRRLADGYLLLDGLYRLNAARALGWERVPALVEE